MPRTECKWGGLQTSACWNIGACDCQVVSTAKDDEEDEASKIFMLYSVDAWTGVKHFVSAHKTLDGAKRGVPEWALQYAGERSCTFGVLANYGYFVILEGALLP